MLKVHKYRVEKESFQKDAFPVLKVNFYYTLSLLKIILSPDAQVKSVFNIKNYPTFCSSTNYWTLISIYGHTELFTAYLLVKSCIPGTERQYWTTQL